MKTSVWIKWLKVFLFMIAGVYTLALLKIVLFKTGFSPELRQLQLIPFTFINDLKNPNTGMDVVLKNILGNFALFIPLGVLLPALFPKKFSFSITVLSGFLISLAFEIIQYIFSLGMSDVDDLLLNTVGCLVGAGLYFGIFSHNASQLRTMVFSFVFLTVFGCCGVLALWTYNPSTLPAQVEYVNEAALGTAARDSADVSAVCTEISDGRIILRPGSISPERLRRRLAWTFFS